MYVKPNRVVVGLGLWHAVQLGYRQYGFRGFLRRRKRSDEDGWYYYNMDAGLEMDEQNRMKKEDAIKKL